MCVIAKSGILSKGIKQLRQIFWCGKSYRNRKIIEPGKVAIGLMDVTDKSVLYRYK
ncbi:hypothetical protein F7734_53740 [Scytonema sp. UIC 10036]|nr:hypothetical protein [Scytonema sp. UIC 10036]